MIALPKTYRAALEHLADGEAKPPWAFPWRIGTKALDQLLWRGWIVRIVDRATGERRYEITELGRQILMVRSERE